MIPHPLTLLVCALVGMGLSQGLGFILQFIGELCADAARFGLLTPRGLSAAYTLLGWTSSLAGAFFLGAAMRLWADKPWPKAALWAALASVLLGSRSWAAMALGCALGAYVAGRCERDPRVAAVRDAGRGLLIWEK